MEMGTVRLCGFRQISISELGVALVGHRISPFLQSLAPDVASVDHVVAFDIKRRSPTLLPVLPKPELVFNGKTVY